MPMMVRNIIFACMIFNSLWYSFLRSREFYSLGDSPIYKDLTRVSIGSPSEVCKSDVCI